jgi:DNA-binding transcriptional LysR family regulator
VQPFINLRQIEAFRAVMLSGSTTGAAAMLNVSQPAVSRQLRELQDRFRVELFIRRNGRLVPTMEAEALFCEVEFLYDNLTRMSGYLGKLALMKAGHLRLMATSPMGHGLLPRVIAQFRLDHPEVTLSLKIVARREMRSWLEAQQFDLAIITLPIEYVENEFEHLVTVDGVCVLPHDHRLAAKSVINVTDLRGEPVIFSAPESPTRRRIEMIFQRSNVRCERTIETHSAASICEMVAAGLGVSLVDPFTASIYSAANIAIRPFRPAATYEFGLVFPTRRPRAPLVEAFASCVRHVTSKPANKYMRKTHEVI